MAAVTGPLLPPAVQLTLLHTRSWNTNLHLNSRPGTFQKYFLTQDNSRQNWFMIMSWDYVR